MAQQKDFRFIVWSLDAVTPSSAWTALLEFSPQGSSADAQMGGRGFAISIESC
jgi:hypothetical protein